MDGGRACCSIYVLDAGSFEVWMRCHLEENGGSDQVEHTTRFGRGEWSGPPSCTWGTKVVPSGRVLTAARAWEQGGRADIAGEWKPALKGADFGFN